MMEEAPYWTWTKRKQTLQSHSPPSMGSFSNSWEEKAFAEDSAGALGGCIWPPRSYSCNFCNREFRSAQALGGHMNVHRRDRARLKQSLSPLSEALHHQNPDNQNHSKSLGSHFSTEVGKSRGDLDPKPCRVSDSSIPKNSSENTLASAYASPIARSCSDPKAVSLLRISESKPESEKSPRGESLCLGHDDYFETRLSAGMNSFVGGNRPPGFSGDEAVSCKRPKTAASSLSFFLKVCSDDTYHLQPEVIGVLKPNTVEDLDLELRLGDPPKVK